MKQVVGELGKVRNLDARHAQTGLGWAARRPEESIVDTARSLIDHGVVTVS